VYGLCPEKGDKMRCGWKLKGWVGCHRKTEEEEEEKEMWFIQTGKYMEGRLHGV